MWGFWREGTTAPSALQTLTWSQHRPPFSPIGGSPDVCPAFLPSPSELRDGVSHPCRFLAPDNLLEGLWVGSPGKGYGERATDLLAAASGVRELGCQSRRPGTQLEGKS